jgi:hypothetical protein
LLYLPVKSILKNEALGKLRHKTGLLYSYNKGEEDVVVR